MNKRGLSSIIITLLIILITLVAITIIWIVVKGVLENNSKNVDLGQITLSVNIKDVKIDNSTNNVSIQIKRNSGLGNISGLKFIFYSDNDVEDFRENTTLQELETKIFIFHLNKFNVTSLKKIEIAPIIKTSSGEESIGNIIDTANIGNSRGGGGSDNGGTPGCTPVTTCVSLNATCGNPQDNCGNTLNCGDCNSSQFCNSSYKCELLPIGCTLTNAFWNVNNVNEGTQVTLTVQGTNCSGQALNFSVWEYDILGGDDPVLLEPANVNFSGNTATTTWISEWQGESFPETDPPEYYFIASLVSNYSKNIKSNDPKLQVNKNQVVATKNIKNDSKYSQGEVFIVSSKDWKNVLESIPLTIWENGTTKKYPLIILQEDDSTNLSINQSDSPTFSFNNFNLFLYTGTNFTTCNTRSQLGLDGFNYVCPMDGNFTMTNFTFWAGQEQILQYGIHMKNIANSTKIITVYNVGNPDNSFLIPQQNVSQTFTFLAGEEKTVYFNYKNMYSNASSYDDYGVSKFLKDYLAQKVTIISTISPEFITNISSYQINQISSNNYFNYWSSINSTVYVEDNYTLSLIASAYASLINAPLIIKNSSYENTTLLQNSNVICIENTPNSLQWCDENYNMTEIQRKYYIESSTDKIILTNPGDINHNYCEQFLLNEEKSINNYCRASLVSPIMAASKKELILFTDVAPYSFNGPAGNGAENTTKTANLFNYADIQLKNSLLILGINYSNLSYLTLIANPKALPLSQYISQDPNGEWRNAYDRRYADFTSDGYEDLSVGRMFGITVSDTSVLAAKSIFSDNLLNNTKIRLNNSYGKQYRLLFNEKDFTGETMSNTFSDYLLTGNYDAVCKYQLNISYPSQCTQGVNPNRTDYVDRNIILFSGHGTPDFGGIWSYEIPELSYSIGATESCSNGNYYGTDKDKLFNAKFIRNGGVGFFGAAGVTLGSDITSDFLNKSSKGKSMGLVMKEIAGYWRGVSQSYYYYGDPTLVYPIPSSFDNWMKLDNDNYYLNVSLLVHPGDPGFDVNNLVTTPATVNVSLNYTNGALCQCTNATNMDQNSFNNAGFFNYSNLFQWTFAPMKNAGDNNFRRLSCRCKNYEGNFGSPVTDSININILS